MKIWVSFRPELAAVGKKVLSYPDHRGESHEGVICKVSEVSICIEYNNYGTVEVNSSGKLIGLCDTSADINLIACNK